MLLYTKKLSIIAGFVGLSVVTLFLFVSSQSEHRRSVQKDRELQEVLAKLNDKDAEIAEIHRQHAEAEKALSERVVSLESSVSSLQSDKAVLEASLKVQEENLKALAEKNEALLKDREALMEDNLERSQNMTDLQKKIADLEAGRQELLDKIKDLDSKKVAPIKKERPDVAHELRYDAPPTLNVGKVGKIIVQKSTGRSAQVQHVNDVYKFFIINAGSRDGLRSGSVINVIRQDRIIAKAVVEKLKPDLSAALLLPEWTFEPVQAGDFVTQF